MKGKRRKGLIIFGIILLMVGILGGGAIVAKGMANYKDAVKSLARAPVGCTTTLVFDKPATYTVYVETKGKLGELSGDCEANGGSYTHPGAKLPKVSMTLLDSNGDEVTLQRGVTAEYDVDGYEATAVRTVRIPEAGTYRLNVESDESDFAVAIGKNPKDDNDLMLLIGGSVALGGLVLGLLLFLLGLRRRRPDPSQIRPAPLPTWSPAPYGVTPTGPPGMPSHPGFRSEPPPMTQPVQYPGQPPIRLPETPPGGSFAPPTLAPPSAPAPEAAPVHPTDQRPVAPMYVPPTPDVDDSETSTLPTLPTLPPTPPSSGSRKSGDPG
ncbi:MAG: hypothetical protein ABI894_14560 [Ilumatobacteraceae bacterium]